MIASVSQTPTMDIPQTKSPSWSRSPSFATSPPKLQLCGFPPRAVWSYKERSSRAEAAKRSFAARTLGDKA
jgi:hypothetical protein